MRLCARHCWDRSARFTQYARSFKRRELLENSRVFLGQRHPVFRSFNKQKTL
jgi:hypothetical protein